MSKNSNESSKQVDIFRDTPVRLLGYANEVGEAFRSLVSKKVVHTSYALAFGYVFMDVVDKTRKEIVSNNFDYIKAGKVGFDCLVWQSFASVLLPGFTINRICFTSLALLNKSRRNGSSGWSSNKIITTLIGLAAIPLIVHPIDHFCHQVMDKTLRPVMGIEPHLNEKRKEL
jgi:fission process protein 1